MTINSSGEFAEVTRHSMRGSFSTGSPTGSHFLLTCFLISFTSETQKPCPSLIYSVCVVQTYGTSGLAGIRPQDTPEGSCLSPGSGSIGAFLENLDPEVCDLAVNSGTDGLINMFLWGSNILMDHSLQQKCHNKSAQPAVRMIGEPLPILSVWRLIPKSYLMFPYRCISNKFTSYKSLKNIRIM